MADSIQSIGIDVASKKLDIFVKSSYQDFFFSVSNDFSGIEQMILKLGETKAPVIIESTGDYHILASCMLDESNYNVFVINPIIANSLIRATIRGSKSDKKDAKLLARLGLTHRDQLQRFKSDRNQIIIKKKVKALRKIKLRMKSLKKSIRSIQKLALDLDMKDGLSDELLSKLEKMEKEAEQKETEILGEYKSELAAEVSKIYGVSEKSAKIISLHLSGKKFAKAAQLVAFTGYDVRRRQSGSSLDSKGTLSKRGDAYLRDVLFKAAWGLKMHNEKFKQIYEKARERGKHYYTCLNILTRKLLRIIFGIMKSGNRYNGQWG